MSQINLSAIHCINPDCQRPHLQPWGNKFCNCCGAPLQLIDRYVPLERLGSGGFAQIFTIWDSKTQTEKVLKVLIEESPKALELFEQEAAVLKSLRHPGVPKVEANGYFQLNLHNPNPRQLSCLVMEKINGETLEEVLEKNPRGYPEGQVLNWLSQALDILEELHKRKIIHRDIKPSNLMLRATGSKGGDRLVLIDFGGAKQMGGRIQRLQSSSTRLFSSGYSPPEQMAGGLVTPATDFYALGRTMIELLTGKYPADLEDPRTTKLRWRHLVTIHPQIADLLDQMVDEDVRSRPQSAADIQKRLAEIYHPTSPPLSKIKQSFGQKMTQLTQMTKTISIAKPPAKPQFISKLERKVERYCDKIGRKVQKTVSKFGRNVEGGISTVSRATFRTADFTWKTFVAIVRSCLDTIWAMLVTGVGASIGTIIGFILSNYTVLGEQVDLFVSRQLPGFTASSHTALGSDMLLFLVAGLGTAWGLTFSGGFGQRRRYFIMSLMGIASYCFGWFVFQVTTPKYGGEGLVGLICVAVFLLTLSLGVRSHHLVHAAIAAGGTSILFMVLIGLGIPPSIFGFAAPPVWDELWGATAFFAIAGVVLSFWLGVSNYLIVPGLRLLGWR